MIIKISRVLICTVLLCLSVNTTLFGVSASPEIIEQLKESGMLDQFVERFKAARAKGVDQPFTINDDKFSNQKALTFDPNTVDTFKVLIILADFSDNTAESGGVFASTADFDHLLFSFDSLDDHYSMSEFYYDNSYGDMVLQGVVTGWYRLPQTYAYYVDNDNGFGSYPNNAQRMAEDAITLADPYVDYNDFDNDNNGWCDGVFVVHAGRGAESTGSNDMIWSHSWSTSYTMNPDGVNVRGYTAEPEEAGSGDLTTMGVYAHEYGHFLGLPDLYDTDYSSSGIGYWSVMAGGSWGGGGAQPVSFDAWCKKELGFLTLTNISSNSVDVEVAASMYAPVAYRLWESGSIGQQYFLIENRRREGADAKIPGSGLLIMHIDESIGGNWDEEHPLVAIEQADGMRQLELDINNGDATDVWSSFYKAEFSDLSNPNSRKYDDSQTRTSVWNISAPDSIMYANFDILYSKPRYTMTSNRFTDSLSGNSNNSAEAEETISFFFSVSNDWLSADNVSATLSSNNPNVSFGIPSVNIGTVSGEGGTGDNFSIPIEFDIPIDFNPCVDLFYLTLSSDVGLGDTTFVLNFLFGNPEILIIDDDDGFTFEDSLTDSFDRLNILYEVYDKSSLGSPAAVYLDNYSIVMWLSGDDRPDVLSTNDISAMKSYMDNGGSLFLTGQSLAGELSIDDPDLLNNYFKADYSTDILYPLIEGVSGSQVGNGIKVRYETGTNQSNPETMYVLEGGKTELRLPIGGDLGISHIGSYRSLIFSFGFEAISDKYEYNGFVSKDTMLSRVYQFLAGAVKNTSGNPSVDIVEVEGETNLNSLLNHTPTFHWNVSNNTASTVLQYQVQLGTGLICGSFDNKWDTGVVNGSDTSIVYAGDILEDGNQYFFRVRVYNGITWSSWFTQRIAMNAAPEAPTILSPSGNDLVASNTPTLTVTNAVDFNNDPLTYDFELYDDYLLTSLVTQTSGVSEQALTTSWTVDVTLIEDQQYFWKSRSSDEYEFSGYSDSGSFYVNAINVAPSAFSLFTPALEEQFVGEYPEYSWSLSLDFDPTDLINYTLWVSLDSLFGSYQEFTSITDTFYTSASALLIDSAYFWKVKAYDLSSAETWSSETFKLYTAAKGCCRGTRGNINYDENDELDISDIVYFITYMFADMSPVELECPEEADVNGDNSVDIEDIVYMIDYVLGDPTGPAPIECY